MKKHRILSTLALAAVSAGMMVAPARALTFAPGDLMIGFFATGGTGATLDYLVNLGPASGFTTSTPAFTLNVTGVATDLAATFGNSWNTRADVRWSLFSPSNNDPADPSSPIQTIYASRAETTFGVQATPFTRQTGPNTGGTATRMFNAGLAYANGNNTSSANGGYVSANPLGLRQAVADTNSYGGYQNVSGIQSFGSSSIGGGWNSFSGGGSAQAADLFLLAPRTGTNQPGTYSGTFQVLNSGAITFSPVPVPEPSTYGLIIGAAAILLVVARRVRKAQTA